MNNLEIERKFKIKYLPDLSKVEKKEIVQHYLYKDEFTACRKRKIIDSEGVKYIYTCKCKIGAGENSVVELEKEISEEKYIKLGEGYGNSIDKTRYIINLENDLVAEVDIFSGIHTGICIVEVEFSSIDDANCFVKPDWFGEEIKGKLDCNIKWSNANLATMSKEEIEIVRNELKIN